MTDIYCRFKDDQSMDMILPDSTENDTSSNASNETESVVSEDDYITQFVLGMG